MSVEPTPSSARTKVKAVRVKPTSFGRSTASKPRMMPLRSSLRMRSSTAEGAMPTARAMSALEVRPLSWRMDRIVMSILSIILIPFRLEN